MESPVALGSAKWRRCPAREIVCVFAGEATARDRPTAGEATGARRPAVPPALLANGDGAANRRRPQPSQYQRPNRPIELSQRPGSQDPPWRSRIRLGLLAMRPTQVIRWKRPMSLSNRSRCSRPARRRWISGTRRGVDSVLGGGADLPALRAQDLEPDPAGGTPRRAQRPPDHLRPEMPHGPEVLGDAV